MITHLFKRSFTHYFLRYFCKQFSALFLCAIFARNFRYYFVRYFRTRFSALFKNSVNSHKIQKPSKNPKNAKTVRKFKSAGAKK
jgi:hypothetical protein